MGNISNKDALLSRSTDQTNNILNDEPLLSYKQATSENDKCIWSDDQLKYYDVLLEITKCEIVCLCKQLGLISDIKLANPEKRKKILDKQRNELSNKLTFIEFEDVYLKVLKHPLRRQYNELFKKIN